MSAMVMVTLVVSGLSGSVLGQRLLLQTRPAGRVDTPVLHHPGPVT